MSYLNVSDNFKEHLYLYIKHLRIYLLLKAMLY